MTPAEFRGLLSDLDLPRRSAAALCGVTVRTIQHWRNDSPDPVAVHFLSFLRMSGIDPVTVMLLLGIEKQSAPQVSRPAGPKG